MLFFKPYVEVCGDWGKSTFNMGCAFIGLSCETPSAEQLERRSSSKSSSALFRAVRCTLTPLFAIMCVVLSFVAILLLALSLLISLPLILLLWPVILLCQCNCITSDNESALGGSAYGTSLPTNNVPAASPTYEECRQTLAEQRRNARWTQSSHGFSMLKPTY